MNLLFFRKPNSPQKAAPGPAAAPSPAAGPDDEHPLPFLKLSVGVVLTSVALGLLVGRRSEAPERKESLSPQPSSPPSGLVARGDPLQALVLPKPAAIPVAPAAQPSPAPASAPAARPLAPQQARPSSPAAAQAKSAPPRKEPPAASQQVPVQPSKPPPATAAPPATPLPAATPAAARPGGLPLNIEKLEGNELKRYLQAAEAGDLKAQYGLFCHYEKAADRKTAISWLNRSSAGGFLIAEIELTDQLLKVASSHADRAALFDRLMSQAKRGHTRSQVHVGNMLRYGIPEPGREAEGHAWLRLAESRSDPAKPSPCHQAREHLLSSLGTEKAGQLLRRECERGNTTAMVDLALELQARRIPPTDSQEPTSLLLRAAELGDDRAVLLLAKLSGAEAGAPGREELLRRAAQAGNPAAQEQLAAVLSLRLAATNDRQASIEHCFWLSAAAHQGSTFALCGLAAYEARLSVEERNEVSSRLAKWLDGRSCAPDMQTAYFNWPVPPLPGSSAPAAGDGKGGPLPSQPSRSRSS